MCLQASHLVHRPSVCTRFSWGASSGWLSLRNQVMGIGPLGHWAIESSSHWLCWSSCLFNRPMTQSPDHSIIDASLGQDAFLIRMLDLAHLGHEVRKLRERVLLV